MALVKFKEAYPDYRNNFGDSDAIPFDSFNVYSRMMSKSALSKML
jgi:hypothetical protein